MGVLVISHDILQSTYEVFQLHPARIWVFFLSRVGIEPGSFRLQLSYSPPRPRASVIKLIMAVMNSEMSVIYVYVLLKVKMTVATVK